MSAELEKSLREMTDADLKSLSDECHGVSPHTHTFGACVSALNGIYVDIEISRRRRDEIVCKYGVVGSGGEL